MNPEGAILEFYSKCYDYFAMDLLLLSYNSNMLHFETHLILK